MARIRFEDGTIVNFDGTPTPEDVDYVAQQLKIGKEQSFTQRVGSALTKRTEDIGQTFSDTAAGKISPVETGVRTVGSVIGAGFDVVGEAITPLLKPALEPIFKTGAGQAALEAIKGGQEVYNKWKNSSPEATRVAKSLEGIVNIASILPAYKAGQAGVQSAVKTGVRVGEAAGKAAKPLGSALEKGGRLVGESAIPLSKVEAGMVQAYKAKNPLLKRIAGESAERPLTAGATAFNKGLMGTEDMIGIQAKRLADTSWKEIVQPALSNIKQTIKTKDVINSVKKKILETVKEPIRQQNLLEGLDALADAYKAVPKMTHVFAQDIKSALYKFIPEATWRGKPIGSALKDVQAMFASELRNVTRKALKNSPDVLAAFDDYGNLKALMEFGKTAMTGAKKKGGLGSFITSAYENLSVPLRTTTGQALKRAGEVLRKSAK